MSDTVERQGCLPTWEYFPRRLQVALVTFLGGSLVIVLRVCISVALTGSDGMATEYNYDNTQKGIILSSFYWGYIAPQLLGGWLGVKYGIRHVFGFGALGTVVFSSLTPLASFNYNLLVACRVCTGLCEGFCIPSMSQMVARWMPPEERSRAVSLTTGASYFGTAITLLISPDFMTLIGWRAVFYIFGVVGVIWYVMWLKYAYNSPADHPNIGEAEKAYILDALKETLIKKPNLPTPWKTLFSATPVWAPCIAHTCFNWSYYTLISFMPEYFHTVLGFKMTTGGVYQVIPYFLMFLAAQSSGQIVEFLTGAHGKYQYLGLQTVRRTLAGVGFLIPAVFLCLIGYVSITGGVILMTAAVGISGLTVSSYYANFNDIAPFHAGVVVGISNTLATVPGIVSPVLCGILLDDGNCIGENDIDDDHYDEPESCKRAWRSIFFISAAIFVFGFCFFTYFMKTVTVVNEVGTRVDLEIEEAEELEGEKRKEINHLMYDTFDSTGGSPPASSDEDK